MATHNRTVVLAVTITATVSLTMAGILFYFFYRLFISRKLNKSKLDSSFRRETANAGPPVYGSAVTRIKIDQQGFDVLYLTRVGDGHPAGCFPKFMQNNLIGEEVKRMNDSIDDEESIQGIPLLYEPTTQLENQLPYLELKSSVQSPSHRKTRSPPSPRPPSLPSFPKARHLKPAALPLAPPPPPPPPPPPGRPSLPKAKIYNPPVKTRAVLISQHKPPIPPTAISRSNKTGSISVENLKENEEGQTKLKPLHWDKVTANADHSVVWNQINDGSFRLDDELMEALFGYTTTNSKSTDRSNKTSSHERTSSVPSAPIFLLDPRKSQNTAIVLRSLSVSWKEISKALLEGRGLDVETLEKLTTIRPPQDEITKIIQFSGNQDKLADADSFLYHILKSVPSAFIRLNAMLFKSTYGTEVSYLKDSLRTLELACKELRSGGIFFKLLEAILKAGNRMNDGTARGNAQGFNLNALRRLSDVKSTDGKTTLLYFVVEQVIRSEGERCLDTQTHRHCHQNSDSKNFNQENDREYLMLGLPAVRGLGSEFVNVKKSASIDYDSLISTSSILITRVEETKKALSQFREKPGGFLREMSDFLNKCEEELNTGREEETRVMEIVNKTTEYYQTGSTKGKSTSPLQLFVIVKDFLNMVDRDCFEIEKKLEKTKKEASAGSSPPLSPVAPRSPMRMHNIQSYFRAQRAGFSSSDSENDF